MLRRAVASFGRGAGARRCSGVGSGLSEAEMDSEIREMNAEMAELFGLPSHQQESPREHLPSSPQSALPYSPQSALPYSPQSALPYSPQSAAPSADSELLRALMGGSGTAVSEAPGTPPSPLAAQTRAHASPALAHGRADDRAGLASAETLAILREKISWCATELSQTSDVERCGALARAISDCARATGELKRADVVRLKPSSR